MFICTADQMRSIDRRSIDQYDIPGFILMDRAGCEVAKAAVRMLKKPAGKQVDIFCGKGNNGGDGFVAGRLLRLQGVDVRCVLLAERKDIKGDALAHLDLAEKAGVPIQEISDKNQMQVRSSADLVIDAILGTGIKGPARDLALAAIHCINRSQVPVLAVDAPSGITSEIGLPGMADRSLWTCVLAEQTVTIGLMKVEITVYPGKAWAGEVHVVDIGFPAEAIAAEQLWLSTLTPGEATALFPRHYPDVHKGDRGRVVVIAGSVGMTGAATLAVQAAMRTGAGMAILGAPESLLDVLAVKLTEVMTRPLPETSERSLSLAAESPIDKLLDWGDILAIGPGLSQHPETTELVRRVVAKSSRPMVIDADGLNAFSGHLEAIQSRRSDAVITPHVGELSRLIKLPSDEITANRIEVALQTARQLSLTVVLKGAATIIAEPSGNVAVNPTGNPGMATAGAGDVLTGIIAGLMVQGLNSFDAARIGVYLHGLSGDLGAASLGQHSLIAGDLIAWLPSAILQVERGYASAR